MAILTSGLANGQTESLLDERGAGAAALGMGDDYFMARFSPKLKAWLALVENRHAGEQTWSLYRSGTYNEPLGDCQYTLARFPNHPGALFLIGEIAKAIHQTSMPIPYFEVALKFYPQHGYTHAQYGHYLTEIGALSAGLAELREALRLDPNQLQARAWLAEALTPATAQGPGAPSDSAKAEPAGADAGRYRGNSKN